jgi:hypothetical protein
MTLLVERDALAQAGPEQGVIEEARRRRDSRRLRASIAALLALLAGAGTLIAASTGGRTPTEAPLHLPPEPSPLSTRHAGSGSVVVSLSPDLEGSEAGWCVLVRDRVGGEGGTCAPLPTRSHPLLTVGSSWSLGEPDVLTAEVTAPEVAYVLVNGRRRVPTVASPGLPYGLRVATVHTPLPHSARWPRSSIPSLVALNSRGQRIAESPDYGDGLPFRDWNRPSAPAKGVCQLHASGLAGLIAEWGQVAMAIHPYPGRIVGRGFLSCVDTEYFVPGRGMRAAVLLDAASPGRTQPAEIPGLVPIPQASGLYNGSGSGDYSFRGPMTAKREGNAWLVVAGGGRNAEEARIRLLRHLTVTIAGGG